MFGKGGMNKTEEEMDFSIRFKKKKKSCSLDVTGDTDESYIDL